MSARFIPARKIREIYDVSPQTLRNWARRGSIASRTIKHAQRTTWLYSLEGVGQRIGIEPEDSTSLLPRVLYARVSSKKQQADLKRQVELLQKAFPDGEIVSDIGSGLNYQRRGFKRLVERICRGEIREVVVTYKDRMLRFGFEFFKLLCDEHGVSIVVWSQENNSDDLHRAEKELQEDLLSIINTFVARQNGLRSGQLKKARTQQPKESEDLPN